MTPRRLYDHYVDALYASSRYGWRQQRERLYPVGDPIAWPFLSGDEKNTWTMMAKRLTPRKRP